MSAFSEVRQSFSDQLASAQEAYSKVESSIIENVRWLTTLTMAAIAALAFYRKDISGEPGLGLPLTLTVVVFLLALLSFILSVILTRIERTSFDKKILQARSTFAAKEGQAENSPVALAEAAAKLLSEVPAFPRKAQRTELTGLALLFGAAFCSVALVFLEEFVAAIFR